MLVLRLTLALAVVLGLMWFAARVLRNVGAGRASGVMEVLARQQIGRGSQVAIVRVGDQALVIGVTETKVSLLTETDLETIEAAQAAADAQRAARTAVSRTSLTAASALPSPAAALDDAAVVGRSAATAMPSENGALHGSILAPSTWRQAVHAIRERTVRSR